MEEKLSAWKRTHFGFKYALGSGNVDIAACLNGIRVAMRGILSNGVREERSDNNYGGFFNKQWMDLVPLKGWRRSALGRAV